MIIRAFASILLLSAACLPAMAEYDDSANVNTAFAQGKTLQKPADANEYWTCATFWHVWTQFAAHEFGEPMMVKLDPALSEAAAQEASAYWEKEAALKMGLGMGELDVETELYIEQRNDAAWDIAEGIVWGEDYSYASILGQCAVPAAE